MSKFIRSDKEESYSEIKVDDVSKALENMLGNIKTEGVENQIDRKLKVGKVLIILKASLSPRGIISDEEKRALKIQLVGFVTILKNMISSIADYDSSDSERQALIINRSFYIEKDILVINGAISLS